MTSAVLLIVLIFAGSAFGVWVANQLFRRR
jgi:uncharacterized membrane protein YsdA (DUF1294 family)